jgi:hypothetical protein
MHGGQKRKDTLLAPRVLRGGKQTLLCAEVMNRTELQSQVQFLSILGALGALQQISSQRMTTQVLKGTGELLPGPR